MNKGTMLNFLAIFISVFLLVLVIVFTLNSTFPEDYNYKKPTKDYEYNNVREYEDFGNNENCRLFKSGLYLCSDNSKYNIEQFEDVVEDDEKLREDTRQPGTPKEEQIKTLDSKDTITRGWKGQASYYSREGCVGCSETLKMANGQPLRDDRLTVAFNKVPLNSKVKVTNLSNNESVVAKVTDTGGFEKLNRIIDLTLATRDAIDCSHLCQVKVEKLKN